MALAPEDGSEEASYYLFEERAKMSEEQATNYLVFSQDLGESGCSLTKSRNFEHNNSSQSF